MKNWQAAEKRPSAAFPSSFVVAAYSAKYASIDISLGLRISGALHLGIFEQPVENDFFGKLLELILG